MESQVEIPEVKWDIFINSGENQLKLSGNSSGNDADVTDTHPVASEETTPIVSTHPVVDPADREEEETPQPDSSQQM